jgi:hypothetical protein
MEVAWKVCNNVHYTLWVNNYPSVGFLVPEADFIERAISLRFLGIILRVLRLDNVYITNQFQASFNQFCSGGGGGTLKNFLRITSKNSAFEGGGGTGIYTFYPCNV